ncbi:TetR/AcrR family transcriptional regulator [Naasia aerilata]|uniref:TetR family transcriptional regulator n=1 Tax=Naasia aerilata TaxID=1162966 RepID=A0ABM8GGW5_9MICO|nr:TetR/AcrR family transcriptional regulator [Naasia aerilata]BDZ47608.1 TetR family transcriptional regulator [Naasia aerilata]
MSDSEPAGRRERKKAATRKAISDAATMLFLERGFDNVSIREVADQADVSPTTVFAHFSQKEALVFDEDEEQRDQLVAVVRNRPAGTSITAALQGYYRAEILDIEHDHDGSARRRFMEFVESTPALNDYAARMWLRHEDALAAVVAEEASLPAPTEEIRVFARFVLQIQLLATSGPDALAAIDAGFRILDHGWSAYEAQLGAAAQH